MAKAKARKKPARKRAPRGKRIPKREGFLQKNAAAIGIGVAAAAVLVVLFSAAQSPENSAWVQKASLPPADYHSHDACRLDCLGMGYLDGGCMGPLDVPMPSLEMGTCTVTEPAGCRVEGACKCFCHGLE